MNQTIELGSTYKHFKGNDYKVLFFAKDSETQEDIVVYISLYSPYVIWVRPLKEFEEYIEDKKTYRFTKVE